MMQQVGILKKVQNLTFEYAGKVYGKLVVGYADAVDGGRIIIREMPDEEEAKIIEVIKKNEKVISEEKHIRHHEVRDNKTGSLFEEE
jgi:hypothetical protein